MSETTPGGLTRRELVATMAVMTAGAALRPTPAHASMALERSRVLRAAGTYAPKIYTAHEWATVRMLVDYIFPKDERSGSATEAGVPEFMDTMLELEAGMRTAHRGGLAWLDHECRERFGGPFVEGTDAHRREILDDIAYPDKAREGYGAGVQWFNSFRDLSATGYWTSEIGVADIGYMGNTPVMNWNGCPQANLNRLGF
ncbi:MAG TPA: gluconate 2-dehydrogenase subunit 3 family protein [Gemmatimonadales bacterium]|nr:gluconate 2-dehydrogenase subunit 3 family protein [Gemmatimonadales bacterium]